MRERQLAFLQSWIYPWFVVVTMVVAYLAASLVDASGPSTSLAIGIAGMASIVFRTAFGWWIWFRLKPEERERFLPHETRAWTGVISTFARWLSIVVWIIGWLGILILTVWSLSN